MIADRLVEAGKVPDGVTGNVKVDPCLVFIDEVHAVTSKVSTVLLSALDERRNTTIDNVVYDFDEVVFLLATTDPGRTFGGLPKPAGQDDFTIVHPRRDGRNRMAPLRGDARAARAEP